MGDLAAEDRFRVVPQEPASGVGLAAGAPRGIAAYRDVLVRRGVRGGVAGLRGETGVG